MTRLKIAIQLYTVRDLLKEDYVGTLMKVHDAGYKYVELADFGGYTATELKKIMDDVGLQPMAGHCPIEQLESNINQAIDDASALGIKYLVCPYLPSERRRDEAGWLQCARSLNIAGQACTNEGITFCYHNHSFEFVEIDKRTAFDLLYEETDSKYVQSELDIYWIQHGGGDPVEYIHKLSGRCPLIHLKDMTDDADCSFAAVGQGIFDFPEIIAAAERAGSVWGIVEQDICPTDPVESIALSLANLKKMGYR